MMSIFSQSDQIRVLRERERATRPPRREDDPETSSLRTRKLMDGAPPRNIAEGETEAQWWQRVEQALWRKQASLPPPAAPTLAEYRRKRLVGLSVEPAADGIDRSATGTGAVAEALTLPNSGILLKTYTDAGPAGPELVVTAFAPAAEADDYAGRRCLLVLGDPAESETARAVDLAFNSDGDALARLPDTGTVRRALGDVTLCRNPLGDAVSLAVWQSRQGWLPPQVAHANRLAASDGSLTAGVDLHDGRGGQPVRIRYHRKGNALVADLQVIDEWCLGDYAGRPWTLLFGNAHERWNTLVIDALFSRRGQATVRLEAAKIAERNLRQVSLHASEDV